jgi:hypothetical protein
MFSRNDIAEILLKMALNTIHSQSESFFYTYVGELKMAAPSEEKLICDKFNLEVLTVNQVKSFKALADGKDVFNFKMYSRSAKGGEKGDPNRNQNRFVIPMLES